MTPSEEKNLFELLSNYAKVHHRCLLAELTLNQEHTGYFVCFRPTGPRKESKRYDCVYLNIDLRDAATMCAKNALTDTTIREMDEKLPQLARPD